MARTFIRQDVQIRNSVTYDDTVAPSLANFETNPTEIETDLNNIRSMLSHLKDVQAGNWYDILATPSTFTGEGETQRGVDDVNQDLHDLERKRILRKRVNLVDVTVGAGNNFVILGTGELPGNTTGAVGLVTTLGTVVADNSGGFGAHSLVEVSGSSTLTPRNLVEIVDGTTRDPILSSGRTVYGLLQSEFSVDGTTITDTTPNRVQISFVRINATGDDLEAVPVADIENAVINYCYVERVGFDDLSEEDFLRGAVTDTPAAGSVDRQTVYDNQGTTPVDLTTNATLDLEGAGLFWEIRDDLEARLFAVIEGSAGGTSEIEFGTDVDLFDNNAVDNDFANGATINSAGTRPIAIGETDGVIESTAGDLRVAASPGGTGELYLDDSNQTGSTWTQTDGIKLSETTAEWDLFEVNFGEVSLLNAINQAFANDVRTKVQAVVTSAIPADTDVNGPGGANNTDVDLPAYDTVTFVDDVEVFVNGILQRNGANDAANEDVYPGTTPANGDLRFEYALIAAPGNADVITVIVNGQ
jgi:hypothetical protein